MCIGSLESKRTNVVSLVLSLVNVALFPPCKKGALILFQGGDDMWINRMPKFEVILLSAS